MQPFIDSRFKRPDYDTMRTAVEGAQQKRATIAGPPPPSMSFDLQGVEKRAKAALQMQQNQGPMPPMIVNGGMPFGRPAAPTPAAAPPPMMIGGFVPPQSASGMQPPPSMLGAPMSPPNALSRGAPAGMGSMLGGPRPAGGRSANDPMRIAEQARRRGDPSLIMSLAGQQQSQQFQREMFGMQQQAGAQRDAVNFGQGLQMFGAQQEAMNQRDAMNFQQQQQMFQMQSQQRAGESALEFQRRQEADAAERAGQSVVGGEQLPMMGGSVPLVKRADGTMSMAGGFMPTPKPAAAPPPGLEPTQAMIGGVRYEKPKPEAPTRLTPVPGAPSMIQGGAATPDRVFDPYTGEFYEAGKVPGRGANAAAAPAKAAPAADGTDTKARMNALRKRLGLAEL